ncbi:hypothetical protein VTO73DRAFT_14096 [Trametes versicolor]
MSKFDIQTPSSTLAILTRPSPTSDIAAEIVIRGQWRTPLSSSADRTRNPNGWLASLKERCTPAIRLLHPSTSPPPHP